MAGLGIGAGAFEGDNARKEQQQRDAQLGLQAASLQQQGRQADMADSRARMGMALDQQNRKAELAFGQQRMDEQRRQFDAGLWLDQQKQGEQRRQFDAGLWLDQQKQGEQRRQFDAGLQMQGQEQQRRAQMDAFRQEQTLRMNDWEDVLNSDKLRVADMQYQELLKMRDEEEKQRQQRDEVAKSVVGQMIKLAYTNGGVPGKNFLSKSQVEYFRNADPRFAGLQTGAWVPDGKGGLIIQMTLQGQDGQPVTETLDPPQQYMVASQLWGQKYADGMFGRQDKAAYNSYLTDRGRSLASKDSRSMSKIDELNYAALAKKNAEQGGVPALEEKMKAIESRYGIGQPQRQEPSPEEQLAKARSIVSEIKKANPYASKDRLRELVRKVLTSAGIQVN